MESHTDYIFVRKYAALEPVVSFLPGETPTQLQILLPGETPNPGVPPGQVGSPDTILAGIPFTFTVRAVDAYWNLVPTVTDTVQLTSTDNIAVLPSPVTLQEGTAEVSATFKTTGTHVIGAQDISSPTITGDEATFVVEQPEPELTVSPPYPTLVATQGATATLVVTVCNQGTDVLSDTTVISPSHMPWVTITGPQEGLDLEAKDGYFTFTVKADADGVSKGYYRDVITVTSTNGGDKNIFLTVHVQAAPRDVALHVVNDGGLPVPGALVVLTETLNVVTEGVTETATFYRQAATNASGVLTMTALEVGDFWYSVSAPGHQDATGTISVTETSESATLTMTADLGLEFSPSSPRLHVTPGEGALRDVVVRNTSAVTVHNVTIARLDNIAWVYLGQAGGTEALAPDGTFTLTIHATPLEGAGESIHEGGIGITAGGGLSQTLPFSVTVHAEPARTLEVTVVDSEGNGVGGADIQLVSQQSTLVVSGEVTDTLRESHFGRANDSGVFTFTNMSLGEYHYYVGVNGYQAGTGSLEVHSGAGVQRETIVIPFTGLSVAWTVEQEDIWDVYTATLELTFDPSAPEPTLAYAPQSRCLTDYEEIEIYNFYPVTIENASIDIDFSCPVFYSSSIGAIAPETTITVPIGFSSTCRPTTTIPCGEDPKRHGGIVTLEGEYRHLTRAAALYGVGDYTDSVPSLLYPNLSYTIPLKLVNEGYQEWSNLNPLIAPPTLEDVNLSQPPLLTWIKVTTETRHFDVITDEVDFELLVTPPLWMEEGKYSDAIIITAASGITTVLVLEAEMTDEGLTIETQFVTPVIPGEGGGDGGGGSGGGEPGDGQWDPENPPWWVPSLPPVYPFETEPLEMNWSIDRTCCRDCPGNPDPEYTWEKLGNNFLKTYIVASGGGFSYSPPNLSGLVHLEINQRISLEREAFAARMVLGHQGTLPVEDISVDITVTDEDGKSQIVESGSGFLITPTIPTDLGSLSGGEIVASWTLIPNALGVTEPEGRVYYVQATLSYVVSGTASTIHTQVEPITVKPQPFVLLDYFIPWYVWEDEPFQLWAVATNKGPGPARNLHIASAQPRIVSNEWGPIDFKITSPLVVNFGTLEPQEADTRHWDMVVNHDGAFVDFKASCEHANYMGLTLSDLIYCTGYPVYNAPVGEAASWGDEDPCLVNQNQGSAGDPVNTYSGNFSYNIVDVSVPTWGDPLLFERTYNSRDKEDGPLGPGWTHNYDVGLTYQSFLPMQNGLPAGTSVNLMEFKAPHGGRLYYEVQGDEFLPLAGVKAELTRTEGSPVYTVTQPNQVVYLLDEEHGLLEQRDANGNALVMSYTGSSLVQVTDPAGRFLSFEYDDVGHIVAMTDTLSRTTYYGYDEYGYLAVVTDTRDLTTTMTYTDSGAVRQLVSITDPNGHVVMFNEYERGRVIRQEDAAGGATTFEYDVDGDVVTTTVTDPLGNVITDTYNTDGLLIKRENAYGYEEYAYDEDYNQVVVTDTNGHKTEYAWDDCGCGVTAITDTLENETTFTYDELHRLTSTTDNLNRPTTFVYGAYADPVAVVDALTQTTVYTYGNHGELLTETSAGHTTHYGYDEYGNLTVITDALTNTTHTVYDLAGRPIRTTDALTRVTTYEYDEKGDLLIKIVDPLTGTVTYTYDRAGNRLTETDQNTHTTSYEYDALNRVVAVTDQLDNRTTYDYDANGNLIQVTDPRSNITKYKYDALNRLIVITDALTGTVTYTYDPAGNRLTETDQEGHITTYGYDELNRVITVTDHLCNETVFGYDAMGNQTSLTDDLDRVTRTWYDALNRPVTVTVNYEDGEFSSDRPDEDLTSVTVYDEAGNVVELRMPGQQRITRFEYDALNRLITTTDALSGTTVNEYDAAGNLVAVTDAETRTTTFEYDELNRLITTTNPLTGATVNEYDAVGNLVAVTDAEGRRTTFEYDEINRLITTTNPLTGTTINEYDAVGNLVAVTDAETRTTTFEYDALNRLITTTNPLTGTTVNVYDGVGNLVQVTNPNSQTTRFEYDELDRLITITNALDWTTVYGYDDVGNQVWESDAEGNKTTFGYDGVNRLITATDALTGTTVYAYDAAGNQASITDPETRTTTFEYDVLNRLITTTNPLTGTTVYAYDKVGNLIAVTDAETRTTTFEYDALNRLITTTDALTGTTVYAYDAVGNRIAVTDAEGRRTTFEYDDLDRLVAVTNPLTGTTAYEYDGVGNLIRQEDAEGGVTTFVYDALDRLLVITDALTQTVRYSYDALGNQTAITDAENRVTTFEYDALNRPVRVVAPADHVVEYEYDKVGNQKVVTDAGQATFFVYDDLYRLLSVEDALGNVTHYGYDRVGNQTVMTDANKVVTRYEYDGLNRLIKVTENYSTTLPDHQTNVSTTYGYDAVGNQTVVTDANGHATHFVYDALNRLIQTTDPLTHTYHLAYDGVGNLVSRVDANEITTTYEYDRLDRLTCITYTEGTVEFGYDGVGNRTMMTDAVGTTRYEYDPVYRMTAVTDTYNQRVAYAYNAAGQRTHLVYPTGEVVTYTHDSAGRLQTVTDWDEGETTYAYDDAGRPLTLTLPNGVQTVYGYDDAGRLVRIEHSHDGESLARYEYELDDVGNRIAVTETPALPSTQAQGTYQIARDTVAAGGGVITSTSYTVRATVGQIDVFSRTSEHYHLVGGIWSPADTSAAATPITTTITYGYDPLNRLITATYSTGESFEYQYDEVGNRKALTTTEGTIVYGHDEANRLTSVNGVTYTYDHNGNLLSDGARTFVYDAANRLTQVVSGTFTTVYTYSGDGVRLAQAVNGAATRYVNDVAASLPQVLQEQRAGTQVDYLYGLGMVAQHDSGTWAYQHPDGLGSVRQMSDGDGQVTLARSYTPFGAPLTQAGMPQGSFGFAGEQADAAAGLTFLRARYYDPSTGRFLTRDPYPAYASAPSTLHRYAYVRNNPVNRVDPSGLRSVTSMGQRGGRRQQPTITGYVPGGSGPRATSTLRPRGPSYDLTGAAANRARAIERINRITRAQSQGHRQSYCGPTGGIGGLWNSIQGGTLVPDLWRWGVQEMRTNPLWHQKTTREEGLRRILGMGIIGAAIVASGGSVSALLPLAIGAGIGGGIGYGAQVWANYQHGLHGPAMWKRVNWWTVAEGAFHGAVSAAAAELIAPLLPSGGTGLAGVLETGIAEFIGGRATQVTLNVVSGRDPDADLWNLLDIALDVVPGMAVAGLREWKAARQADDAIRAARQADLPPAGQFDDAARQLDVDGPRMLPAGEPTSLANRPDRLLPAPEPTSYAPRSSGHPRALQRAIVEALNEGEIVAFRDMPWGWGAWARKGYDISFKPHGTRTLAEGPKGLRLTDAGVKLSDLDPVWALDPRGMMILDKDFMKRADVISRAYGKDVVLHGTHWQGMLHNMEGAVATANDKDYLRTTVYVYGKNINGVTGFLGSGPALDMYRKYRRLLHP